MIDDFDNSSEEEIETQTANLAFEEFNECYGEATDIMRRHLLCNMCGGHLAFNHLSDYPHGLIQETARCPDCGVRVRQRIHKLQ